MAQNYDKLYIDTTMQCTVILTAVKNYNFLIKKGD